VEKIVVCGPIDQSGLDVLLPRFEVRVVESNDAHRFATELQTASGAILKYRPLTADHLEHAPGLGIVSRHGVGYDSVDVDALRRRGIRLTITNGANAVAVAEHTVALILATLKGLVGANASVRAGKWHGDLPPISDLAGKRVLVIGAGKIGQGVMQRLSGFACDVGYHDPALVAAPEPEFGSRVSDLPQALAQADIVTLHVPLMPATRYLVDPFACKPGVIIINTARGGLIDEQALTRALESGHVAAVGLDVFEEEPLQGRPSLPDNGRSVLTPHVAALSDTTNRRMAVHAATNIVRFFDGALLEQDIIV